MYKRPISILVLSLIHFLLPFFYFANIYRVSNVPFFFFFHQDFLVENWVVLANYTVPLWIASFAIWKCHKWSYVLFISSMIWISARNFYNAYTIEAVTQLSAFLAVLMNIFIITYFLKPSIRTIYMDPKLRWWENQIRYNRILKIIINKSIDGEIQNISIGGVFVQLKEKLKIGQNIEVAFEDPSSNEEFYFHGEIVYVTESFGHGIKFSPMSRDVIKPYRKYIKSLKKGNVPQTYPNEGWAKEFVKRVLRKNI